MRQDEEHGETGGADRLRVDRWLWCARFFKSRSSASAAVAGGLVHVNGERVKPARAIREGDRLEITLDHSSIEVVVTGIPERRGPAPEARRHYEETAASVERRERMRDQRQLDALSRPQFDGRPDKRQRRELARFERRQRDD
jgi:ribosome-associated heat shock protein Hsp15